MKIELHLHTSRHSGCATVGPDDLIRHLVACSYGAVFITEHDEMWDTWELAELQASFPGIRIFPGVEIALGTEKTHLLVLGTADRSYLRMPTAQEVILRAREENVLTVLAHPFRWQKEPLLLQGPVLPDAIEHCTCNHNGPVAERSQLASIELHLPMVNAGDVHSLEMSNRYWIETAQDVRDPAELRDLILANRFINRQQD